jgi:hypothetical protein
MKEIKYAEDGKIHMTFDEYMKIVTKAEQIDGETEDDTIFDQKRKYRQKHNWPKVEDLIAHDVEHRLPLYLPYLVYYSEVYSSKEPGFKRTEAYIKRLFREYLVIED